MRNISRSALAPYGGILLLLLLPAFADGHLPAAIAKERAPSNWTYRDPVHRFSLRMLRGFQLVPQRSGEHVTICKFRDPKGKGKNRGTYDAEVQVVRYNITGENDAAPAGLPNLLAKRNPTNIWDATLNRQFLNAQGHQAIALAKNKFKRVNSKDEPALEGRLWQFELPLAAQASAHVTLAEFVKDGWALGIYACCGTPLAKSYAKRFALLARTLRYSDLKAKDGQRHEALDGVVSPERRKEIEMSMVAGWGLTVSPKKNYVVLYNTDGGKNHVLAKALAGRIEALREQKFEKRFRPLEPIRIVSVVRVCLDRREYYAYGGPGGTTGFWSQAEEELALYDASRSKKPDKETLAALHAIAFQQYIGHALGAVTPAAWFEIGYSEYYGGVIGKGGKLLVKPNVQHIGQLRKAIVQGPRPFKDVEVPGGGMRKRWEDSGYTPLEELVRFSKRNFNQYPAASYAQAWSFIYFLRKIVPHDKTLDTQYGHILKTYYYTLREEVAKLRAKHPLPSGVAPGSSTLADSALERAQEAAFRGVKWAQLQAAWLKAMGALR